MDTEKKSKRAATPAQNNEAKATSGASIGDGGCHFSVWAPHANSVVVEIFPGADAESPARQHVMHRTGDVWSGFAEAASIGDGYRFQIATAEGQLTRIDPYARQVTHSRGIGIIADPLSFDWSGDNFMLPPHNQLVIYEMHVGSFVASEANVSQFRAAVQRLPHLKSLGITAVQIMPVAEFAGDLSWGYNPAHIFAVESSYGGPDGLKTFIKACHAQGIAVILDVVYNHFGPSDLDIWRFDGWSENDGGGIYFYNDHRAETPWGRTRPDYGRGEVRQFIRDNAMMWLNEYRIDGLRFDMTLYIRSIGGNGGDDIAEGWSLMQWVNDEIRSSSRPAITIAEDLRGVEAMTAQTEDGGAGFHSQWDANFVHPVRSAVIATDDGQRSMADIRDAISYVYNGDAFRRVVYSESHDEVANGKARVPHEIDAGDSKGWFSQKRSILAAGLVFTAPGIPMIFQGQEFLQGEWFRDDVPLDWALRDEFSGIVRFYRDMIRLRRNMAGTTAGLMGQYADVFHMNEDANVCAFHRWDQHGAKDDVIVVINLSNTRHEAYRIGMPAEGKWRCRLNSDSRHYSADFENSQVADAEAAVEPYDGMQASTAIDLPPYTMLVYSQD